jgi:hypothetical protein
LKEEDVIKKVFFSLVIIFGLVAGCRPVTTFPSDTTIPSPTLTATTPPQDTSTPTIWWSITSTPLDLPSRNNEEIILAIDQIAPNLCIKKLHNYAILTPPPTYPDALYPKLQFTDVSAVPVPKPPQIGEGFINERLDNIDKSFTAFKIFVPNSGENQNFGDTLYIVDNVTGKIFQVLVVETGAVLYLDSLQWLNKDIFFFTEQGHSITIIIAINVKKQRYEYYAYEYENRCN